MMKSTALYTLLLLLALAGNAQTVQDAQLWKGVVLEKTIVKDRLKVSLNEEARLEQNFSMVGNAYTDIIPEFRFNKRLSLGVGYRYSVRPDLNSHRVYSDFTYSPKDLGRFILNFRTRFQHDMNSVRTRDLLRQKFQVAYNLPDTKLEPYVGFEPFFKINSDISFDNYRLMAGIKYPIHKKADLRAGYIWDRSVGDAVNDLKHIFTLRISVSLDKGDGKEKDKEEQKED